MATQTDKQNQKVTKSKGYKRMSTKKEVVGKGVFQAELDEFFKRELAEDGYSGIEVRKGPSKSEIIVMATRTQSVLGEGSRRIRELASVIRKRFGFEENDWQLYAERVPFRGLCAIAQCESLRYKLTAGIAVRRACYGVVRYIMDSGANGCEVVVSGKLRGQRAKSMKFVDGVMIHSGDPVNDYIDQATRKVLLRQGVLGIKVNIMLPHDPQGRRGPKKPLPDQVEVIEPKDEEPPKTPQTIVRQPQDQQQPPQQQQQQQGQQQPPQSSQPQQQQQPTQQQGVPPQMQMPPQQQPPYQQMGEQYRMGPPSGQMPQY